MRKIQNMPGVMWLSLLLAFAFNTMVYYGARVLTTGRTHYDLSCGPDKWVPFLPWTITIYWGCYLFWLINYIMGCGQDEKTSFRFISADLFAKAICFLCFLLLPTTNTRPVVAGGTIWEEGMRLLYRIDAADNLFPSIHCLTSWFCYIAVRENKSISKTYRVFSLFIAICICISTLTTRQHVIADVIGGIGLAEISYYLVEKNGFSGRYKALALKIFSMIPERRRHGKQKD